MESTGIQVLKPGVPHSQPNGIQMERTHASSPARLAKKLPPITDSSCQAEHPSTVLLQSATSELKDTMKHLLSEASTAESRIQRGIDTLWQKMMEMIETKTIEMELQLSKARDEASTFKEERDRVSNQEKALVQQNAGMSMELVEKERKCDNLEKEMKSLKDKLNAKENEVCLLKDVAKSNENKHKSEMEELQMNLEEKKTMLKEYHDKLSKMTEKVQKISKQLSTEKASTEQLQKSTSSQMTQQVSDNRKMALEISKLKSQLASSGVSLTAAKEEVKKFELKLKKAKESSESSIATLNKQHRMVVKTLEDKISSLQRELDDIKLKHEAELASVKEHFERVMSERQEEDGYLDVRIRFLQHQNQQEKIKLIKEKQQRQKQH